MIKDYYRLSLYPAPNERYIIITAYKVNFYYNGCLYIGLYSCVLHIIVSSLYCLLCEVIVASCLQSSPEVFVTSMSTGALQPTSRQLKIYNNNDDLNCFRK